MADFQKAVEITLKNEGGFQKDPNDKGNWTGGVIGSGELKGTKYGISAAQFPNLDIENLTTEQANGIYWLKYWNKLYDQIEEQTIADKLFDLGVLSGVEESVKIMQGILNVKVDGLFGPGTLTVINGSESDSLLQTYKTSYVMYATKLAALHPPMREDLPSWIRRINS